MVTCPKCGDDKVQHIIFCLLCVSCRHVFPLPPGDTTGVDFLVERYASPTSDNSPGQDVSFVPLDVNQKN